MTAQDVAYSFNLLKLATHPQHALWADTGLKSVKVSGNNVVFSFAGKPGYQEFDFYRFNVAVVPQHVFSKFSNTDLTTGNLTDAEHRRHRPVPLPVGLQRAVADDGLEAERQLVGDQGARPQGRADLRRRHQERHERGGARQLPGREHRPLQQLRPEGRDQGQT